MKRYFKSFILIVFSLILVLNVACTSLKADTKNTASTSDTKNAEIAATPEMNEVISNYISDYYSKILTNVPKVFEAHKIYGIEEKDGLLNVYIYTTFEGYAFANGRFGFSCGGSNPALIVLKRDKDKFTVVKYEESKNGTEYGPSIKKMFPRKYAKEALSDSGRDLGLSKQIKLKATEWLKTQGRSEVISEYD